jgi:hypothetical protein
MNNKFNGLTKSMVQSVMRVRARRFALNVAIGCALLCSIVPLFANEQVPFKGNFNIVILSATPVDATHVRLAMDVHVQATQLGKARGPASAVLDVTTLAYTGQATWVAANGDAVSLTFDGQFVPTATPGVLENLETLEITGGTGRFEGATGEGVAGGLLDAATFLPLTTAPFIGSISSTGSIEKEQRNPLPGIR